MEFHGKTEKNFYFLINIDLPLRLWLRRFFFSVILPLHCPEIDRQGALRTTGKRNSKKVREFESPLSRESQEGKTPSGKRGTRCRFHKNKQPPRTERTRSSLIRSSPSVWSPRDWRKSSDKRQRRKNQVSKTKNYAMTRDEIIEAGEELVASYKKTA